MSRVNAAALAAALGTVLGLAALPAAGATRAAATSASPASPAALSGAQSFPPSAIPRPKPVTPAVQPGDCQSLDPDFLQPTSTRVTKTPWAQSALNFEQAWQFSQGSGITVAVVDSGVNWSPQLQGRAEGIDLTGTGPEDCVGHGIGVAGIIAASDDRSKLNDFAGVAPQAKILSVKVTNTHTFPTGSDITLADGIYDAAALGAQVISVSVQTKDRSPAMAAAVAFAQSKGAVVVAAGGNDIPTSTGGFIKGPFYPASYPGVLSVGAIQETGALAGFSDQSSDIQVTAPGLDITSVTWQGYSDQYDGTSFATPFVAGVAALLRSYSSGLTEAQVVDRIVATADGNAGVGTGNGLVNPLQAITDLLPRLSAQHPASSRAQRVSVSRALPPDTRTRNAAMMVTMSGLGGAALLILASLVIIQGRRRQWRPGRAGRPEAASAAASGPGLAPIPDDPSDLLGGRW